MWRGVGSLILAGRANTAQQVDTHNTLSHQITKKHRHSYIKMVIISEVVDRKSQMIQPGICQIWEYLNLKIQERN